MDKNRIILAILSIVVIVSTVYASALVRTLLYGQFNIIGVLLNIGFPLFVSSIVIPLMVYIFITKERSYTERFRVLFAMLILIIGIYAPTYLASGGLELTSDMVMIVRFASINFIISLILVSLVHYTYYKK